MSNIQNSRGRTQVDRSAKTLQVFTAAVFAYAIMLAAVMLMRAAV